LAGTPHVGQGTEDNCLGVRSLIRIERGYGETVGRTAQFGTLLKVIFGNNQPHRMTVHRMIPTS
jgi:hypothetical protein